MPGINSGIGMGIDKGSSQSWISYWNPLTLVVENAQPTHVVITFPSAKTVLASDFTIAGFTIVSGSWSGNVYTLVLSSPVAYGDIVLVGFNGKYYVASNNVLQIPSYSNSGGQGDRTGIITVTKNFTGDGGSGGIASLVNGSHFNQYYFPTSGQAVAGNYVRFDFGAEKFITEATWYQNTNNTNGIWKWQGSNDLVNWIDIGANFTLGGIAQVMAQLSANVSGYRYYQILGISGNYSGVPYQLEVEFKIAIGNPCSTTGLSLITGLGKNITLVPTGTGIGVGTLTLNSTKNTNVYIYGSGRFYDDAGCTTNERSIFSVTTGGDRTVYIKCSNTPILQVEGNVFNTFNWSSGANAPSIGGDFSDMTNIINLSLSVNNTISFDLTNFVNIVSLYQVGDNAISGDISNLIHATYLALYSVIQTTHGSITNLTNLYYCMIIGDSTITGDISGLVNLLGVVIKGNNTVTGDISNLVNITGDIEITGHSTIYGSINGLTGVHILNISGVSTGDLANLPNLTWVFISSTNIDCSTAINCKAMSWLHLSKAISTANTNQILADFWANRNEEKPYPTYGISLNGSPSGQGIIDAANLTAFGYTVATNTPVYDADASALFGRMTAAGETPTDVRKVAINNCITSLKANGLFDTQFDVLVVTRAHGPYSGLMNWIGNTTNGSAINSPTFTANVGYNSNGTSSYLKSNYNAHTQGVLFTVNDAGFGFKISGTITSGIMGVSRSVAGGQDSTFISTGSLTNGSAINSYELSGSQSAVVGYNMNSRYDSAHYNVMRNSDIYNITANSNGITNNQMYLLNINNPDGVSYYCNALLILEVYWMGKSMTQAQFLTFQTIMNTYFAAF